MAGPSETAIRLLAHRAARYERDYERGHNYFPDRGEQILSELGRSQLAEAIRRGSGWLAEKVATSTWVSRYGFWAQGGNGGLAIQFHDGATCWYPSLGYTWFYAMTNAASKGKFIHEYIYKKIGYQLVSG